MWEDVVKQVFQVTTANADYELVDGNPFYVYLLSLTSDSPISVIIKGKPSADTENVNVPFTANQWNPILVNRLNITQELLDKYAVFIGLNYIK